MAFCYYWPCSFLKLDTQKKVKTGAFWIDILKNDFETKWIFFDLAECRDSIRQRFNLTSSRSWNGSTTFQPQIDPKKVQPPAATDRILFSIDFDRQWEPTFCEKWARRRDFFLCTFSRWKCDKTKTPKTKINEEPRNQIQVTLVSFRSRTKNQDVH